MTRYPRNTLQNLPSRNKDIRPMFIPRDGYKFVGSDYS